jgi:leader peptidase (prepilin peptidase)/N-methyltransferase
MTAIIAVLAGVLGACFGSFLNVVIYRVPRRESIVRPGSRCPSCGLAIRGPDNIPIVSWLALRGRCRSCGASISARYPLVEAGTALLWIVAALRLDSLEEAAFVAVAGTVLIALALIDLEHRRIPNVIVLPSTAAYVVWVIGAAAATHDWGMAARAVACGGAYFGVLLFIALASGGMGFGDVKLGAFVGVAAGRFGIGVAVAAALWGFILGGLVAVVLLVAGRRGRKDALPFGPSMAAGGVAALLGGSGLVRGWLGL